MFRVTHCPLYLAICYPTDFADEDFSVSLTLLHLAAKWGFTTLSDRLIDLPDSAQAASLCRNRDGKTPTELARQAGYTALADRLNRLVINGSDSAIDRLSRKINGAETPISAPVIPPVRIYFLNFPVG